MYTIKVFFFFLGESTIKVCAMIFDNRYNSSDRWTSYEVNYKEIVSSDIIGREYCIYSVAYQSICNFIGASAQSSGTQFYHKEIILDLTMCVSGTPLKLALVNPENVKEQWHISTTDRNYSNRDNSTFFMEIMGFCRGKKKEKKRKRNELSFFLYFFGGKVRMMRLIMTIMRLEKTCEGTVNSWLTKWPAPRIQ